MSIISMSYALFVAAVLLVYYIVPKKVQWIVLLVASYSFYLFAGVTPLLFVMGTTLFSYGTARWMDHIRETSESKKEAKPKMKKVAILSAVVIFGVLFMLKYYNFFAGGFNSMFDTFKFDAKAPLVNIILPMGISFYMFTSVGYCVDVYRGNVKAERNLLKYALFISFFPLAVQGPINRYKQLGDQLTAEHPFDYSKFTRGLQLVIWGLFKKLVIADRLSILVGQVFGDYTNYDGTQTLVAMVCYALQIYTDFSGGIDIIRGVAEAMGIDLVDNFARPYFGNTVSEYWRRWHMSLTNWMRDFVFYPLTLSKMSNKIGKWGRKHIKGHIGKQLPSYIPTFVTFFLIGIWHGAGWGFIVFGLYNATIIVVAMMLQPVFDKINKTLHINDKSFAWRVVQIIRTFAIMTIGKTFTRASSVGAGWYMIKAGLFHCLKFDNFIHRMLTMGLDFDQCLALTFACLTLFTASVLQERGMVIRDKLAESNIVLRWAILIGGIMFIVVFGIYGPGYDASAFIYREF